MKNNCIIRKVQLSDLEQITIIDHVTFQSEAYPITFFRQAYDLFREVFFVSLSEGKVSGYCIGAPQAKNKTKGWILSIVVLQEYMHQGCGSRLISKTLEALRDIGCHEALLTVHPNNKKARSLFAKYYFVPKGSENNYFGPAEPRIVMRAIL